MRPPSCILRSQLELCGQRDNSSTRTRIQIYLWSSVFPILISKGDGTVINIFEFESLWFFLDNWHYDNLLCVVSLYIQIFSSWKMVPIPAAYRLYIGSDPEQTYTLRFQQSFWKLCNQTSQICFFSLALDQIQGHSI